jgi:hypothetical protein
MARNWCFGIVVLGTFSREMLLQVAALELPVEIRIRSFEMLSAEPWRIRHGDHGGPRQELSGKGSGN